MSGTEKSVQQAERYLAVLQDFTAATRSADGIENGALALALRLACGATGWPIGHVLVADSANSLRSSHIWQITDPDVELSEFRSVSEALVYPENVGLPGRVLATRTSQWIARLDTDPRYLRRDLASAAGLTSAFAFPLRTATGLVAVCEVYTREAVTSPPRVLDTLVELGSALGRVIDTARTHNEPRLRDLETQRVLDAATDALVAIDADDHIMVWNRAAEALFGWRQDDALGRRVVDTLIPARFRGAYTHGLRRVLDTQMRDHIDAPYELLAINRAGHEFPVEVAPWLLENDGVRRIYSFIRDITNRKRHEAELERNADYDPLTGLPNRKLLLDRIAQLLAQRYYLDHGFALLFVDLDHFKQINDNLGHAIGDAVLVTVADRLREAVRPMDTVARLSGDEFVAVCPDVKTYRDAAIIADRIITALSAPIAVADAQVTLTASIGIAITEAGSTTESLIQDADAAMYQAKRAGRGRYELFDASTRTEVALRLSTERDLRDAVKHEQLRLYFQPIIGAVHGDVVGIEALLRWAHPERGLLAPAAFLSAAEETGLIVPIGTWVGRELHRSVEVWQNTVITEAPLWVSINLSARQLTDPDLITVLEQTLVLTHNDPDRVVFGIDVTEHTVMHDPHGIAAILHKLKDRGFRIAADDFGDGYSSLSYLREFPIDVLKVGRSFIQGMAAQDRDRAIVGAVTGLAHALGLQVVAQGVESSTQAAAARAAGADFLQGFLYGPPQPLEQLLRAPRRKY